MKIRIYKDPRLLLLFFVFYYTLFIGFFLYNFNLPQSLLYICDLVVIFLLILSYRKIKKTFCKYPIRKFICPYIVLLIWGTVLALVNDIAPFRWAWSLRNWGRFFAFFLLTTALLNGETCKKIIKFTLSTFQINTVIICIQFIFFPHQYTVDSFNGLFGRDTSSVLLVITLVVSVIASALYVSGEITIKKYLLYIGNVLLVSITSELKVIPVFLITVLMLCLLIGRRFSLQALIKWMLWFALGIFLFVILGILMRTLYPNATVYYSISGILEAATNPAGYGFNGGVDRLNFISVIDENLYGSIHTKLAGIGMGNAEYSTVADLTSPFYHIWGQELGYLNFSTATLYIEVGIIGLCLFIVGFFVSLCFFGKKVIHCCGTNHARSTEPFLFKFFPILGAGLAFTNIFLVFYNNIHRTDVSYLCAFYLGVAYVGIMQEQYKYGKENN